MSAADFRALKALEKPKKTGRIKRTRTKVDEHTFDSRLESQRYGMLRMLEKCGEISDLELQPRYPFEEAGVHCFTYVADFRYKQAGAIIVEDAKGQRTQLYKLKKKLIQARYGIVIHEWPENKSKSRNLNRTKSQSTQNGDFHD